MSYQREWLIEDQLCYIEFYDEVTLADLSAILHDHTKWLAESSSNNPLHYIINTTGMLTYPRNIFAINHVVKSKLPQTGWILMIMDDYHVQYIGNIFAKKLHLRVKMVSSVSNGYEFLKAINEILPIEHTRISSTGR